jgi:hypothetical protein
MPDAFKNIQRQHLELKLILVITTAPSTALAPLSHKLRSYFTCQQSSWKICQRDIVVLNEQLARKHQLIVKSTGSSLLFIKTISRMGASFKVFDNK